MAGTVAAYLIAGNIFQDAVPLMSHLSGRCHSFDPSRWTLSILFDLRALSYIKCIDGTLAPAHDHLDDGVLGQKRLMQDANIYLARFVPLLDTDKAFLPSDHSVPVNGTHRKTRRAPHHTNTVILIIFLNTPASIHRPSWFVQLKDSTQPLHQDLHCHLSASLLSVS